MTRHALHCKREELLASIATASPFVVRQYDPFSLPPVFFDVWCGFAVAVFLLQASVWALGMFLLAGKEKT